MWPPCKGAVYRVYYEARPLRGNTMIINDYSELWQYATHRVGAFVLRKNPTSVYN